MEVAHRYLEHERVNDGGSSSARMPTEAHPTSRLAETPISAMRPSRRWGTWISMWATRPHPKL